LSESLFTDYRSASIKIDGFGYHNPAYDEPLTAAEAVTGASRRMHLLEQAEHLLLNDTRSVRGSRNGARISWQFTCHAIWG
jgi:ABC-type oligopeptide transport system substrate-binding subunit